jgi:glycosyltransferase involved in cell wall biosynthesis
MLFSVLIAHFNNTRYLPEALNSVLAQTYSNWEIILVDDGSTEDFDATIQPYLQEERIRIFRNQKNNGCGYTKHRCAHHASGHLMGFLDPDDVLLPDALHRMALVHRLRPDCSLAHSTHYVCDHTLDRCRKAEYVKALPDGIPYLMLGDGRIHHFASFKKSAYARTQGIDKENLKAVDQDLYYLLEEQGTIVFLDEPLYKYRIHRGGISTFGKEAEATKWHQQVIMKACMRRMRRLKADGQQESDVYKQLRQRFAQVRIQHDHRMSKWVIMGFHILLYPFQGGWQHLRSYGRKLFFQGPSILQKTFREDHRIQP